MFRSKLEYILPAHLTYTKNLKCGLIAVFDILRIALQKLENIGITFIINGLELKVFFVVSYLLGDTLGLNTILGHNRYFRGDFCCRICIATFEEITCLVEEIEEKLRRNINDERSDLGKKEICPFEEIPSFFVDDCVSVDIFHDFNEFIWNYVKFSNL